MIEYLRGKVLSKKDGHVLLDVNGVGYGLDVPGSALDALPEIGAEGALHVSLVLREDSLTLYGFATPEEKKVFDIFLGISGIGPRTALDILTTLSISDFVMAVRTNNLNTLTRIPGIGKKKAERMVMELKDRIKDFPVVADEHRHIVAHAPEPGKPDLFEDALLAMQALGYKPADASRSVTAALRAAGDEPITVEQLVKLALQKNL
ncbi:TPA: Holliday junction branch migration protein RuvA [Candidatus Sumerlaeota bacterium]|jgi:holliday junction DNA helicase RuvA|nr:Holliday junction branch migration protein RuvA [Candidatus Sumerlaeota bacterium]